MFLAGVRHKLEGYRRFLREIGDGCSSHNVLVQYIYQDDSLICEDEITKISELKHQIKELCKNIQQEFGENVIEIVEKKIFYAERLGILAAGHCFVRTCRRESFSLDIYEFLNLKILLNDYSDLSYILSGLSGVTTSLSGAVKVNPFDVIRKFILNLLFELSSNLYKKALWRLSRCFLIKKK
jgi:trehalose-6-phosphate synthase